MLGRAPALYKEARRGEKEEEEERRRGRRKKKKEEHEEKSESLFNLLWIYCDKMDVSYVLYDISKSVYYKVASLHYRI